MPAIYRRNICAYDAQKNILASKGTDSANNTGWTVPSGVSYIRMTFDKTYDDKAMITKNLVPTKYSAYFEPYDKITEDFLTPESKAAVDSIIDHTITSADLKNNYACALPKGWIFLQTVGLPQAWYYANAATPVGAVVVNCGVGAQYGTKENTKISFPNEEALNSSNGYTWTIYDQLLVTIMKDDQNSGYGAGRKIVAENLSSCSLLAIGDSTIDSDTMTQYLLDYFTSKSLTLTLLGTLGSGSNKNEGRAGWKATDYLTDKKYEGVTNPFYNNGTFDFSYYMTNQGYSAPDFVVIQLGINDLYNSSASVIPTTWEAIETMIDSIREYNSNIKIILNLPTAPNSDWSKHSAFLPAYRNRVVRYNEYAMAQALAKYGRSKVRPSYCHLILDPDNDISDNVHPKATGYEKMAKEVINQINCWQNGV